MSNLLDFRLEVTHFAGAIASEKRAEGAESHQDSGNRTRWDWRKSIIQCHFVPNIVGRDLTGLSNKSCFSGLKRAPSPKLRQKHFTSRFLSLLLDTLLHVQHPLRHIFEDWSRSVAGRSNRIRRQNAVYFIGRKLNDLLRWLRQYS